uniref:Uncharacterized protein n=1 Tax=Musa acuminata subsp. malaccensis TaxID=214687 RepID=A0A804KTB1_MUSAM
MFKLVIFVLRSEQGCSHRFYCLRLCSIHYTKKQQMTECHQ